jgi:hypothetical protein
VTRADTTGRLRLSTTPVGHQYRGGRRRQTHHQQGEKEHPWLRTGGSCLLKPKDATVADMSDT